MKYMVVVLRMKMFWTNLLEKDGTDDSYMKRAKTAGENLAMHGRIARWAQLS